MLRFLTAGESHGQALVVIVEGVPAGLRITADDLAVDLARRQLGYGRGRRMAIESDRAEILSGVRRGETLGSPITLQIRNRDWDNWQYTMSIEANPPESAAGAHRSPVTRPRPGHADLAGGLKYGRRDLRDILERASARETAARVAAGAIAKELLRNFDIEIRSGVVSVGNAGDPDASPSWDELCAVDEQSPLRAVNREHETMMVAEVDRAREAGETLGGTIVVA